MKIVSLTDNAKKFIESLDEFKTKKYLKVKVAAGGCSGLRYKLEFTDEKTADDGEIIDNGITLLVDRKSASYILGTEIDYEGGLNGQGFIYNNPMSKRNCGCGESFGV